MSRQETTLRHDHCRDPAGFLAWAAKATRGEFSIYHHGNLSADRLASPEVEEIACLVLLLSDTNWINAMQARRSPAHQLDYLAVRTGSGFLPRSIVSRSINAADYRVLNGLLSYSQSPGAISMRRAIRALLPTCSEDAAELVFRKFDAAGWIEPREGNRNNGWQISAAGMMMLR